jgi:hypothetical protein
MSVTTFPRVKAVVVDESFSQSADAYLDASFPASNSAQELSPIASVGACYRGMPVGQSSTTGGLMPINTAGVTYCGVLLIDVTAYVIARNLKVGFVRKGRARSYAGGALNWGDPVKADTSANFSGFVKWTSGSDAENLYAGRAYPLQDGSTGTVVATMVQGDAIFVDLQGHN